MGCTKGLTQEEYCKANPATIGCPGVSPTGPDQEKEFNIASGEYTIDQPVKCGKQKVYITYPTEFEKGPFPIVTFGHGQGNRSPAKLLGAIARRGIVVVAVDGWCDRQDRDMIYVIHVSKALMSLLRATVCGLDESRHQWAFGRGLCFGNCY